MFAYNNCNKLNMVNLIIIIKILQQSCYNENINKIFEKNLTNIKHKKNVNLTDLIVKKSAKDKANIECILPIKKLNIDDDIKSIPPLQEVNIEDNKTSIPPIQESNIENNTKSINNKYEITTTNDIYDIPKNINTNNHNENFISPLPIIITKKNIDIPIESTFELINAILDVENMKKHIYLTNSKVLPMYENYYISSSLNGKLF